MSEKRMYARKVTDSDAFIELSSPAQALYFHLNQGADDDGFNNQIQNAMFKAHASIDDLKILLMKNFIIQFDNGVIVISHWRIHNTLRKDRYSPTNFQEELRQLGLTENGKYERLQPHLELEEKVSGNQMATKWQPNGNQMATQYSIDKNRLDKYSIEKNSIDKISIEDIQGEKRREEKEREELSTDSSTQFNVENSKVIHNKKSVLEELNDYVLNNFFSNINYDNDTQKQNTYSYMKNWIEQKYDQLIINFETDNGFVNSFKNAISNTEVFKKDYLSTIQNVINEFKKNFKVEEEL